MPMESPTPLVMQANSTLIDKINIRLQGPKCNYLCFFCIACDECTKYDNDTCSNFCYYLGCDDDSDYVCFCCKFNNREVYVSANSDND